MPHVSWTDRALADVARLAAFLRPKSPQAAKRAVTAIREGAELLQRFPQAGRPMENIEPVYRELPVGFGNSGYYIYYRLDRDAVRILAVRHAREAGYYPPA